MFSNNEQEDLKINKKAFVKVYYTYDDSRKLPFKLFESESFFSGWRAVGDYKTLEEAQESGRSRAVTVLDMGLFEKGHRKGMMSWWDEPKPVKTIVEMAVLPPSTEVEYDSKVRKVSKSFSKRSSQIIEDDMLIDIEEAAARIALSPVVGVAILDMEEEIALKRNRTELRK